MKARAYFRTDRERWVVIVEDRGRRISTETVSGVDAEARAHEKAAEINAKIARGLGVRSASVTVDDAFRFYFADYAETLSRAYEQTARGLVSHHIRPLLGERELASLSERDAVALGSDIVRRGRSPAVARNALSLLRTLCSRYVREGALGRNPFEGVGRIVAQLERRHGAGVRQIDAWSVAELEAIFALARKHEPWLYPLLVFLAHTGCRRGEAIGLSWDAVDFGRRVVQIRDAKVRGRITTPKSGRARTVPLDAGGGLLLTVLEELAETRHVREAWQTPWMVFRSPRGAAVDEGNRGRAWDRLRGHFSAARVRPLRLHDFRHTFASHALHAGVSVPQVAAWLGHATPEVTLRVYAHALPGSAPQGWLEGGDREVSGALREAGRDSG